MCPLLEVVQVRQKSDGRVHYAAATIATHYKRSIHRSETRGFQRS